MKLSIITATYNAESTISDCIDSVVRQDIDVEHIIVDGASTDRTMDVVGQYSHVLATVISEPDNGLYDAMNKGLNIASGDVIGILNADDFYPSSNILKSVLEQFKDESVGACFGDLKYVDAITPDQVVRYWKSGKYRRRRFYYGWMPPHPTFFVRSALYQKYGGFNLDMGTAADYELMLRFLLKYEVNAVYIPRVLVHMRNGGVSNASLSARIKASRMDRKAWTINDLTPHPWTLPLKPIRKIPQWILK